MEQKQLHGAFRYLGGFFETGCSDLYDLLCNHCCQWVVPLNQIKRTQSQFVSGDIEFTMNRLRSAVKLAINKTAGEKLDSL